MSAPLKYKFLDPIKRKNEIQLGHIHKNPIESGQQF